MSGWDWFIVAAVPFLGGLVVGWATVRYAREPASKASACACFATRASNEERGADHAGRLPGPHSHHGGKTTRELNGIIVTTSFLPAAPYCLTGLLRVWGTR